MCFPVCPCGTDTVGLSADQKGPCVGVEAVEIPYSIVVLVCMCVGLRLLFPLVHLRPRESTEQTAVTKVIDGMQLTGMLLLLK